MGLTDRVAAIASRLNELYQKLSPLFGVVDVLAEFGRDPITFLKKRFIPLLLGAVFSVASGLADALNAPFAAIARGLGTLTDALVNAVLILPRAAVDVITTLGGTASDVTAGLGPLQPFVLAVIGILSLYATLVVAVRIARGIADSIPVLSGVETFLR